MVLTIAALFEIDEAADLGIVDEVVSDVGVHQDLVEAVREGLDIQSVETGRNTGHVHARQIIRQTGNVNGRSVCIPFGQNIRSHLSGKPRGTLKTGQ
jgi:hypothetical protein